MSPSDIAPAIETAIRKFKGHPMVHIWGGSLERHEKALREDTTRAYHHLAVILKKRQEVVISKVLEIPIPLPGIGEPTGSQVLRSEDDSGW